MRLRHVFLVAVLAVLFGILGGQAGSYLSSLKLKEEQKPVAQETAYERVMRTQTLRCGYVAHPPHVAKDPATGAMSGAIVDIMNEAGNLLKIRIEWPEEVGWGNTVEALKSGRVDAICTDFWMNPVEGRYVGYSVPLYYETLVAYGRADDHRFDNNIDAANDLSVTFSAVDGSLSGIVAQQDFPKAKVVFLPNLTDTAQILKEVDAGKGDLALVAGMDGMLFEKNTPGRLRNLTPDKPVRAYAATIAVPQNDIALKTMLDSAFAQLLGSRFVDKALDKNGLTSDVALRVARPYEVPHAPVPVAQFLPSEIPVSGVLGMQEPALQLPALPPAAVEKPAEAVSPAVQNSILLPAPESDKTVPTQKAPVPAQKAPLTQ